ncbi:MAG: hypothetical protein GY928_01460 [Colwellia sp.]|nr:hypothetical protein [Colwellia sp.]
MITANSDTVLTQDELDFISELDFDSSNTLPSKDMTLNINGDDKLLERLDLANELQMQARYDNHKFIFPVKIIEGELGLFQIELQSPEIFEIGSHLRNWRYKLEQPIIGTCKVANTQFDLNEISTTGFCLDVDDDNAPGTLELELNLPNAEKSLLIKANKVRKTELGKIAYTMHLNLEPRERLRRFLFTQHRLQSGQDSTLLNF